VSEIPVGLCQCGCGEKTYIPRQSRPALGWINGVPCRWKRGHAPAWNRRETHWTESDTGCWVWLGPFDEHGYGVGTRRLGRNNWRNVAAHRAVYEELVGPIPDGLVLDHLCRNPPCVNPEHLEPVTQKVNVQRGLCLKLTEDELPRIYELTMQGTPSRVIAGMYGVGKSTINARLDAYIKANNLPALPRLRKPRPA